MKYESAKLRRMLAPEYVLGTLHGSARARFQRLLRQDALLRREVQYWETRLGGLNGGFRPAVPREVVWAQLDRVINTSKVTTLPVAAKLPARVNLWRAWAIAATVAAAYLAINLQQQLQREPLVVASAPRVIQVPVRQPLPYVALLQPAKVEAKWMVSLYPDRALMKVSAVGNYKLDAKHSLELWNLEKQGPRSLGVLPMQGQAEMPLPKSLQTEGGMTLAVSVEPRGGSPTGSPTGPVILSAPAVQAL